MALTKVTYKDGSTVISAKNLNDIQDEIISQASTKAPVASPNFTGTPKAPTAAENVNNTQIASTAFANRAAANAVKYASNPNLIDNWYFGPGAINQRGNTTMTGVNKYIIDRWKTSGYASTVTELTDDGLTIQNTSTSGPGGIYQYLRTPVPAGTTVTISALASLGDGSTGVGIRFYFEDGTYQGVAASSMEKDGNLFWTTVTLKQNCVRVQLRNSPNVATVTFKVAKLEVGNTQTLAHKENGEWVLNELPDSTLELLKCQRYLVRFSGKSLIAPGLAYSASYINFAVPLPVAMVSSDSLPTINCVNCFAAISATAAKKFALSSPVVDQDAAVTQNTQQIRFSASGMTDGQAYLLRIENSEEDGVAVPGYLEISKEA